MSVLTYRKFYGMMGNVYGLMDKFIGCTVAGKCKKILFLSRNHMFRIKLIPFELNNIVCITKTD